jgi:long-chain acyl-CoA synthetase
MILRRTVTETYLERVRTTPNRVGFRYKPTYEDAGPIGKWKDVTYREFDEECRQVAFGLMGLGVKPQDKVVILANTRYEWALCDMAILGAGAVTVPIYASNTPDDCAYILNHSEAVVAVVENAKQLEKLLDKQGELKHLKRIVVVEPLAGPMAAANPNVLSLTQLKALGTKEDALDPGRFEKNLLAATPEDLLTICYTSGTTGIPKGVMITHANMVSVLDDAVKELHSYVHPEQEVFVAFLPFSHVIGKLESMAAYTFGYQECYAESIDKLMQNIGEIRPTLLFAVPRIFEKAYARVNAMLESGSVVKKKLFHWALGVGREYYSAVWKGERPSLAVTAQYQLAHRLVFSKVAQRFGGRLRFSICGGAPLPKEIGEFFQIIGVNIIEGYGLTETCAPCTMNPPNDLRFGTVGKPMPEVQIKVGEDGEILIRSAKVFKGYYKMPKETAEAVQDGWFHTGDIGHIDDDGFIHITDRKKDLIITSGGKNIAPQKIENLAKSRKYISQFFVHGDRRNYLTALVTLDKEQVEKFATEQQILFSEYKELVRHPKIIGLVQKIVADVNSHLASFETIKKFRILPQEFTVEAGEMTASMKLKRNIIHERFKHELDSMYA